MLKTFSNKLYLQDEMLAILKKDYAFVDMHVHTSQSHDSNNKVRDLLLKSKKLGIGLAITDHNKYKGAMEAAKAKGQIIIPGIELLSFENKELLAYFYSAKELEEFYEKHISRTIISPDNTSTSFNRRFFSVKSSLGMAELIDNVRRYNCILSIPHPFTYPPRNSHHFFRRNPSLLRKIDAIEVLNSTVIPLMNRRAEKWALEKKKAFTGGSDSHTLETLGNSLVGCKAGNSEEFLDQVRKKNSMILGRELRIGSAFKEILEINDIKREKTYKTK